MRVTAAGTRLQLPHTGTAFTQAAWGSCKEDPKKSELSWGGRKISPQTVWGEEEGR